MKKNLPVVYCVYTETKKRASDILAESFRLFLGRSLANESSCAWK